MTTVQIALKNPRSAELEKIALQPPGELPWVPQPTPLESRHFAATYALHRVSSMKNVQHMLPPTHKRFWAAFEDLRAEDRAAGKAWRYEADPFAVAREHAAAREKQDARRAAEAEARDGKKHANSRLAVATGVSKGWQSVPVVDMSRERRRETEALVRRYHVWNPAGVELAGAARDRVVAGLCELGFRRVHALEACEWARDAEEALEWLLIHVPEDDVPARFLPENYSAGISVSTGESLGVEYAARRLAAAGYSLELCFDALRANALSEDRAAEALMQMLVAGHQTSPAGALDEDLIELDEPGDDVWAQERESLEAIYGPERFSCPAPNVFRIALDLRVKGLPRIVLEARRPTAHPGGVPYPFAIPTFALFAEGDKKIPAHVRLSVVRQTAEHALTHKGDQMLFTVVMWLEDEILRIMENPGPLRDVASAVTGSDERDEPAPAEQRRRRARARKGPIDWTPGSRQSQDMLRAAEQRHETPAQQKMMAARMRLPAWQLRDEIVAAVNGAQVTIISGETGSGKSTQSVQFVLDDLIQRQLGGAANIVCTQPRRISALGLADRVSDERCQAVGTEIGYAIRGESKQRQGVTKVTFVTTGVLLRRLQTGDTLEDVSHIVIDEVHERSLDTDFLLILVKRIIAKRKDLKIILMSATLDADVFAGYFGGRGVVKLINIEGRTFPVTDHYLDTVIKKTGFTGVGGSGGRQGGGRGNQAEEDDGLDEVDASIGQIIRSMGDRINYGLIANTVMYIDRQLGDADGAILIFLPGTYIPA